MVSFDPVKFMGFVAGASVFASLLLLSDLAWSKEAASRYSKLDESSCMTLIVEEEQGYSQQVCKGMDGVAVFVSEGDLRMDVSYGTQYPGDRYFTFGAFNRIGDVLEWRMAMVRGDVSPFATILRWYVELDGEKASQALVITKIAHDDFCVAGFIEASVQRHANELAREVADRVVPAFKCGRDEPQWYGKTGPLARATIQQ